MDILTYLNSLFPSSLIRVIKKSNYSINGTHYHTRHKLKPSSGSKYPFNINPGTLEAKFEILLFGQHSWAFIIPIEKIRQMYNHPDSYTDSYHPNIRIYTIDAETGDATYARGGIKINLNEYRKHLN